MVVEDLDAAEIRGWAVVLHLNMVDNSPSTN